MVVEVEVVVVGQGVGQGVEQGVGREPVQAQAQVPVLVPVQGVMTLMSLTMTRVVMVQELVVVVVVQELAQATSKIHATDYIDMDSDMNREDSGGISNCGVGLSGPARGSSAETKKR